ncbi:hypothetical protein FM113_17030 [Leucobacter sp. 7(1)]|uniref:DUF6434 domain-containing protein n=1 Tax=Leucobacter sp. 7(1) TaxID=1255613 RepID=UPI00097F4027|nr:DUF6434 domain-containing protein [Leucobacter sp. 7(1)]SJN13180.1 hypothetical protein FM113_17030 [Leucobacter sp. 7(1)]
MTSPPTARPALTDALTEREFLRWYWLKAELEVFARGQGIRATGNKELLTERIAAALAGRSFREPAKARRAAGKQLTAPITSATIIPAGQRSSQVVRAWLSEQLGADFHFDAAMREFFARSDGTQTMQDALECFAATRTRPSTPIDAQFEYNRFTRAWHTRHPDSSREELFVAWRAYRNTPVDERSGLEEGS